MVPRRATTPPPLLPTGRIQPLGVRCQAHSPTSLPWTWREVGCRGSAADCGRSCTISARPGDSQDPRGTDASRLQSVTSDGWMHLDLLQHRTRSVPKLSGYPPRSQQSTWISRAQIKKATPPLHPFSRQQNFSPGEGKQLLSKPMGYGGSQPPGRHGPCGSRSQPGSGTLGLDPVGGPWWGAFAFPQEDGFLRTKAMALE